MALDMINRLLIKSKCIVYNFVNRRIYIHKLFLPFLKCRYVIDVWIKHFNKSF